MNIVVYEVARRLAAEFGVPSAHVGALISVESGGVYDPCQIRFEGHYLYDRLKEPTRTKAVKAGLAAPKAGGVKNPKGMDARYALFERACQMAGRQAAIESTSWGVGQVMGAHWKALGYASADALRLEAMSGLEGQARLMMRYVRVFGLLDELAAGQWTALARGYNGPAYAKNRYDVRLAQAAAEFGGKVAATDGMLRLGAKGARVRELQGLLVRAGAVVKVDGDFGPTTRDALKALQGQLGLTVDGVAGPETLAALAAYKTAPDERVGKARILEIPGVAKAVPTVAVGALIADAKTSVEGLAGQVGDLAAKASGLGNLAHYAELAASGLVTVAGVLGVAAAGYAAWSWIKSHHTYEGVAA